MGEAECPAVGGAVVGLDARDRSAAQKGQEPCEIQGRSIGESYGDGSVSVHGAAASGSLPGFSSNTPQRLVRARKLAGLRSNVSRYSVSVSE